MRVVEFDDEKTARASLAALDAESGYPAKGTHVGGGRHVDMDAPGQAGWTMTTTRVLVAKDGTAALVADDDLAARVGKVAVIPAQKWSDAIAVDAEALAEPEEMKR